MQKKEQQFYKPTVYKTGVPQQAEREEENKLSVGFGNDMKLPKAWSPLKD